MSDDALQAVQEQLKAGLAGQPVDEPAGNLYAPGPRPRILNGIVVPAISASAHGHGQYAVYTPVAQVKTLRAVRRAVGCYLTAGQWLVLWIGDDSEERDAVLAGLLAELGEYSRRKR